MRIICFFLCCVRLSITTTQGNSVFNFHIMLHVETIKDTNETCTRSLCLSKKVFTNQGGKWSLLESDQSSFIKSFNKNINFSYLRFKFLYLNFYFEKWKQLKLLKLKKDDNKFSFDINILSTFLDFKYCWLFLEFGVINMFTEVT